MTLPYRSGAALVALLIALACGGGESPATPSPEENDPPPSDPRPPGPGPYFSVSPIPLDQLARITPLGHNNKILPIGHTYWSTCDQTWFMPSGRPCLRERLQIRAPGPGVVSALDASEDGGITIEGPPGLYASFAHVTPRAGLQIGDTVQAGDTIARMYGEFNFDFGLIHTGLPRHQWVNDERIQEGYAYSFNPISQFPEPLRSQLSSRVQTFEDPLGRLVFDVAGTAQGNWFEEGTPPEVSFRFDQVHHQLFLGRLQERHATAIVRPGWTDWPWGNVALDPDGPAFDAITPDDGVVALKAWRLGGDGTADRTEQRGTFLVEMLSSVRLRIEYFDTHEPVDAFTEAARIYER